MIELLAIGLYFLILFGIVFFYRKRGLTQRDFVIGNRSMNRWMTALAAHASDMSNWLLMAYPGMIYLNGGKHLWVAIGLILMMWLNWKWIAPKVRSATEKSDSVTLVDFFEKRLGGNWAIGRLVTSGMLFLFYTVYIAGALFGMGFLIESLFGVPYWVGVIGGVFVILPYVLIGGYLTLAQIDLFQGMFLLAVLLFVPIYVGMEFGFEGVLGAMKANGRSLALVDGSIWEGLLLMLGWGIGYFGQPHIISKFMGIKNVEDIRYSKRIGISWLILSLVAASMVGFVGVALFGNDLKNPEQVFIQMVRGSFPAFVSGIFLCAIIQLRPQVDLLILSIHWGPNMEERPTPNFKDFAHQLIEIGVDIIHGHSAHLFQGIEVYKKKIILYDTGDFIDDYYVDPYLRNDRSFFFIVEADKQELCKLRLIPALISNFQVNKAEGKDAEETLNRMQQLSKELNTTLSIENNELVLQL